MISALGNGIIYEMVCQVRPKGEGRGAGLSHPAICALSLLQQVLVSAGCGVITELYRIKEKGISSEIVTKCHSGIAH